MAETFCIGLYTPNGHRRLEVPCRPDEDYWISIDRYDRRHGTDIYDMYDTGTIETDERICREYPPYDPSDEEYTLTGEVIADLVWDFRRPSKHWIFDDCAVKETSFGFAVYMQGEDGGIVRQDIASGDMDEDRRVLDDGYAPTDGWEDGIGNSVRPSNGDSIMSEAEITGFLRKYPLDNWPVSSRCRSKASNSRKSGTSTGRSTKATTRGGKKPAPKSSKNVRSKPKPKAPARKTTSRRC